MTRERSSGQEGSYIRKDIHTLSAIGNGGTIHYWWCDGHCILCTFRYVMSEVAARDDEKYCLSMELVSRQTSTILALKVPFLHTTISPPLRSMYILKLQYSIIPCTCPILQIPLDNKVEITFHYQQVFSLVKRVNVHRMAVSVLEELYQCVVACGLIDQEKW